MRLYAIKAISLSEKILTEDLKSASKVDVLYFTMDAGIWDDKNKRAEEILEAYAKKHVVNFIGYTIFKLKLRPFSKVKDKTEIIDFGINK